MIQDFGTSFLRDTALDEITGGFFFSLGGVEIREGAWEANNGVYKYQGLRVDSPLNKDELLVLSIRPNEDNDVVEEVLRIGETDTYKSEINYSYYSQFLNTSEYMRYIDFGRARHYDATPTFKGQWDYIVR